ncbi:OmpH family outer membrane protein [candidate division TA06 bacterium]|nr:OmpH family outer membrane protein [candidate division TA06 bacterium]
MSVFLFVIFFALSGSSVIAFSDEFKVGYIDSEIIFQRYQGSSELKRQLEEDLKEWEEILIEKKKEIEELSTELESQRLMLSDEARTKKVQILRLNERKYENFVTEIYGPEGKARKREKELTQPLLEKINRILVQISEEEGYVLIFDLTEGGIVYGRPGLDLTERVLEELNQELVPIVAGKRKEIYVFPLRETNTLAREEEVGNQVTVLLEQALLKSPVFIKARGNVGSAMVDVGVVQVEEITRDQAFQVGRTANVAMLVMGTVLKRGASAEVTVELLDVSQGIVVATEQEISTGDQEKEIADMVNRLAGKLVRRVQ